MRSTTSAVTSSNGADGARKQRAREYRADDRADPIHSIACDVISPVNY
jgi:hypothetical protein